MCPFIEVWAPFNLAPLAMWFCTFHTLQLIIPLSVCGWFIDDSCLLLSHSVQEKSSKLPQNMFSSYTLSHCQIVLCNARLSSARLSGIDLTWRQPACFVRLLVITSAFCSWPPEFSLPPLQDCLLVWPASVNHFSCFFSTFACLDKSSCQALVLSACQFPALSALWFCISVCTTTVTFFSTPYISARAIYSWARKDEPGPLLQRV